MDAELVQFDEGCAEAIANYVLYKIYLRPESTNTKLAQGHEAIYRNKRVQLYRDTLQRTAVRYNNESPSGREHIRATDDCIETWLRKPRPRW